jgi:hypothetical protein
MTTVAIDTNKVAEIIKRYLVGNDLPDTAWEIAEHFADYFEERYFKSTGRKKSGFYFDGFRREQFLKDCGVE